MSFRDAFAIVVACVGLGLGGARGDKPAPVERQVLRATHLDRPIAVDGDAADWPTDAPRANIALDPDSDEFRGNGRVAWDAEFVYVVFEVTSGKEMRNAGDDPATAFKTGDTVELFLSVNDRPLEARVPRGPNLDTARSGDYRILMTLLRNSGPTVFGFDFVNPARNQNPLVFQIAGPRTIVDHAATVPGAEFATRKAVIDGTDGFVAEARLPWRYFRETRPKAGDRLLFNLAINFSNQAGTANMGKAYWNGASHMVQDVGVESQIHPEQWGWLELSP